ncbi:MAG: leucyl aminopeptidase [Solirubrobacterales bacterium]|nr:leucyl aminopeptidase [Solirubrobacterales bacterium]
MHVEATTASPPSTHADTIAIGVFEGKGVAHELPGGELGALLESGEARRTFKHLAVAHAGGKRFVLVGLGAREAFDGERARIAAAIVHGRARELGTRTLCWELPHHVDDRVVAGLVEGTLLHAYRFARYRPAADERRLEALVVSAHHDVSDIVRRAGVLTRAQNRARDLGNTPANDLTPEDLAQYASRVAGVKVTVMDGEQIREAGMGAFAAVARGSATPPRLIRLEYGGADAPAPQLALVGKAVTFDSGGLALKSASTMHEMKFDMAGGAAVIEALAAIAELELPVRLLGLVGATENLPSGTAMRAGDIVTAQDGTTIEVNNPDAEGRLVLADCLCSAVRDDAAQIVDVATLTGGVVTALGSIYAGLFANDGAWADRVRRAGDQTGELVWPLPLHPEYAAMIKGRYAQLTNRSVRREATAVTAAEFLHHFAGAKPWAHLDIAGMAWDVPRPYFADKGATGFGVRLLVELAAGLGSAL